MTEEIDLEKNLFVRVFAFGLEKSDGFDLQDLINAIKPNTWEQVAIQRYIEKSYYNHVNGNSQETPFLTVQAYQGYAQSKYIISYDAQFSYLDYLELKNAQKIAKESRWWSSIAILLSLLAIGVSAAVPWLIFNQTQNVKLTNEQEKILTDLVEVSRQNTSLLQSQIQQTIEKEARPQ